MKSFRLFSPLKEGLKVQGSTFWSDENFSAAMVVTVLSSEVQGLTCVCLCGCVCMWYWGGGLWLFIYGMSERLWRHSYGALIFSTEQISNGFHLNNVQIDILRDTSQYSPLTVDRRFGGLCHLHLQVLRISHARTGIKQVASRAKMEAMRSSKCSDEFQRIPRGDISEDRTFRNHSSENLKSYTIFIQHIYIDNRLCGPVIRVPG
jgi:hypothetical protein